MTDTNKMVIKIGWGFIGYELLQLSLIFIPFVSPVGLPIAWGGRWFSCLMGSVTLLAAVLFIRRVTYARRWLEIMAWLTLAWTLLNGFAIVVMLWGLFHEHGWWIPLISDIWVGVMLAVILKLLCMIRRPEIRSTFQ
jgi:hypothetical protein